MAIPLAWLTALSRTSLNAHWLSDVVGGAALGTGYALAAPRLVDLLAVRFHRRSHPHRLGSPDSSKSQLRRP